MKAIIEYSKVTRHYYIRMESARAPILGGNWYTRKDEAERVAKKNGATEIEHVHRSATRDLEKLVGFSHDTAKRIAKMF